MQLQMHIHELQIELENLMWNRKELEERLQMAIKECRMMETMLAEVEDEQDEAIVKIEMLEREVQSSDHFSTLMPYFLICIVSLWVRNSYKY